MASNLSSSPSSGPNLGCSSVLDLQLDSNRGLFLVLGVLCTIGSSIFNTAGTLMMKLAQDRNDAKPKEQQARVIAGVVLNGLWLAGLIMMTILPVPLEGFAVTLATQSIIAPFAGVNIVLSLVVAPKMLGETVDRQDWHAVATILCGTIMCTLFGVQKSTTVDAAYLTRRWASVEMLAMFFTWLALALAAAIVIRTDSVPKERWYISAILWGFLSGSWGGALLSTIFKGMGELLQSGASATSPGLFGGYVVMTIFFAVGSIVIINLGLQRFDGTLFYPLYLGFLIIFGVLGGMVFFEEHLCYGIVQWILFPLGVCVTITGMIMIAVHRQTRTAVAQEEEEAKSGGKENADAAAPAAEGDEDEVGKTCRKARGGGAGVTLDGSVVVPVVSTTTTVRATEPSRGEETTR